LNAACSDRLHEQYRAPLIPGFREVVEEARRAGAIAVFLSGAGPTVMAICRAGDKAFAQAIAPALTGREGGDWTLLSLEADDLGAAIEG
jgi:homoserine kinase